MSDPYDYEDALTEIEAEAAGEFVWGGKTYTWIAGEGSTAKTLGFGGFDPEADLVAVVRRSQFKSAKPALKETVTTTDPDDKTYSIDRITADPTGIFWVWSLNDPNKGA